MVSSTGKVSFSDIQDEFGGSKPITLSEYYSNSKNGYTKTISGIPNTGSGISLSTFRGKSKPHKTVVLQSGYFNAPGSPGRWLGYTSPTIKLPSDYRSTVSWNLKFNCTKQSTRYGFAYPHMGIKNSAGKQLAVVSIKGSHHQYHHIERNLNNQKHNLGKANDDIKFFIDFFTYANLTNCRFSLTLTYKTL